MILQDFLTTIKSRGAKFAAPATPGQISITNTALQSIRAAMLPQFMSTLYSKTGAINLDSGYIFGPNEIGRGNTYPIPSIISINQDTSNIATLRGKTIFGRNDLFWFAFDAFGTCYMLDNTTLATLRKYDHPYRALADCLISGKI